jgi:hypothetical protein
MKREYLLLLLQVLYHYLHEKKGKLPKTETLLVHSHEVIKEYYKRIESKDNPYISTEIPIVNLCELLLEKTN